MMKYFLILFVLFFTNISFALEEPPIVLEHAPVDIHDVASIKRGAKFFAHTCMACHTMIYLRYNPIAMDAGVLYDKMPINVKSWPFGGIVPPDLSLEADKHSADWIYTYLHSFYMDPSRPSGSNNLVVPNTAMPDMVAPYQGQQTIVPNAAIGTTLYDHHYQWYDLIALKTPGSMSPEEFDATVTDLVNFLVYAADPYKVEQQKIGVWVIGFLIIMFILMYLLKHAYWDDLKRRKGK